MNNSKKEDYNFDNLTILRHPLVQHKMSLLRDVETNRKLFSELVQELTQLLMWEALVDTALQEKEVSTPLEKMKGHKIDGDNITVVSILRAGLGMLDGALRVLPTVRVGFLGLERDHDTLEPTDYYNKIPLENPEERTVLLLDPMLATGGTASAAIDTLKNEKARNITFLCIVAAPEGVDRLKKEHPDVAIYTAALDRELNDSGYILPGLGDAGDRQFGTK